MRRIFYVLFILIFTVGARAADIQMDIAVLRGLDKVTGRIKTFSIPVGQTGQFGRTYITPDSCYTKPPEESPENAAFLFIYEKSLKGENIELFKGWMFSSNPALSSMEHPVYDIWVLECQQSENKPDSVSDDKQTTIFTDTTPVQNVHPQLPATTEETVKPTNLAPASVQMEDL